LVGRYHAAALPNNKEEEDRYYIHSSSANKNSNEQLILGIYFANGTPWIFHVRIYNTPDLHTRTNITSQLLEDMAPNIWYLWLLFVVQVYSEYYFLNPPNHNIDPYTNPVYTIGDTLDIKWGSTTDSESMSLDLLLYQGGGISDGFYIFRELLLFSITHMV
jgi:hypothetical protein